MPKSENSVDTIKTTLRIPKDLIKKFKHLATDKETTVTMLVIEAMKKYLDRNNELYKNSYKPDIDYLKKEEFVKKFKNFAFEKREVERELSMWKDLLQYLEVAKVSDTTPTKYEDKEEMVRKFWNLANESEVRVATVKEALKDSLARNE